MSLSVKLGLTTRLLRFMTFVHLPFSLRSLNLFRCFTRVYEGHFVLCYKEELEELAIRSCYWILQVIGLHDFCCYLHVAAWSLSKYLLSRGKI